MDNPSILSSFEVPARTCDYCGKPLPENSNPLRRFCNDTHRESHRQRTRRRERRFNGCFIKVYYDTIEEALQRDALWKPGMALRTCHYCQGFHATSNRRGTLVVLVRYR